MKWPGRQERDTKTSNGRGDMLRFFTNEKLFKLQTPLITQTNRVYANRGKKKQTSNERLYVERQALAKLWFLLVYPCTVRQLYILLSRKSWWMWCTRVLKKFIPQICKLCPSFILEQDGVRWHTLAYTLPYNWSLVSKLPEIEFWPSQSLDLNSSLYCLWVHVETVMPNYQDVGDFYQLKKEIVKALKDIPQATIDRAILTFWKRFGMCINSNGGHIEHYFWV